MRLVFFGTPDFATPSLGALADAGHDMALVVSQPDKPRGRGRQPQPTPVRARAEELGLPTAVLQRGQRKALYQRVLETSPELAVVVAFGHIVREPLLNGPPHGCLNLHASLLPRWRGPAPIHRAILAGDRVGGVSTMRLAEGVDTGPVYERAVTPIGPDETAGELHDRLAALGARLLVSTVKALEAGEAVPKPQDETGATLAPMLSKEEGTVDFDRPVIDVHNRIRGLDPWPGTTVRRGNESLKLASSQVLSTGSEMAIPAGTVLGIEPAGLRIACADGEVLVRRIQAPGRRWQSPHSAARGGAVELGDVLTAVGIVGGG